ncbi:MAG: helix-turn-helix transcriptional regulator [Lachnospiraceae bacterium]|nr:helix-turn-helix transcriptional regulator [Lachnospiraceae bacterium]
MGDFHILAIRIKSLRTELNLTQRQFAEKVGCTAATLSAYENGSKSPSLEIVKNIADKCNVSIDWLVGLSNQKRVAEDRHINTLSDVIDILFKLDGSINFRIEFFTREVGFDEYINDVGIVFFDEIFPNFMIEWKKMKELHDDKTIDDDLYSLWMEKILIKYKDISTNNSFIPDPEY